MTALGFGDKSSAPEHYPLPKDIEKISKAQRLEYLHGISEKVVDSFIFQSGEEVQKLVDGVLTEHAGANPPIKSVILSARGLTGKKQNGGRVVAQLCI